jgi:nucleoside-diphosphate-sugar epimerase
MHLAAPTIADTLRGRHLLVTGATGFVGKVWLSHLLAHVPNIGRVTLVVRSTRQLTAAARAAELLDTSPAFRPLRETLGDGWPAWIDARVDVVDGDVTRPLCGLDEATIASLAGSVDATLHIAGLTDFQPDPAKGLPANVDGARHVADLVSRFRHRRLLHVSTCYVAGHREGVIDEAITPGVAPSGARFDVEAELDAVRAAIAPHRNGPDRIEAARQRAADLGWPNLYTYTKGLAEHLLAARSDLDLTIARPSVVECARSWPFPGWNEGLNTSGPIMWFCGTPFPHLPSTGHHPFDIVPVDAVARWLTVILARLLEGTARPVWQLATSDVNPATFDRIIELTALGKRRHAARSSASWKEKAEAWIDVRPAPFDDQGPLNPSNAERWLSDARDVVERVSARGGALSRLLEAVVPSRRTLTKQARAMGQLRRMLEMYRPFIHDHHWIFRTDAIRAETARLHAADAPFHDDLTSMCWRSYWLDVQYPGMVRWSFPLMDGRDVPLDPPSDPPLALGRHRVQGAA